MSSHSFYMPKTVTNTPLGRNGSVSSEAPDSVPLNGTRASAEKARRNRESWEAEYEPPAGSRASKLKMSQRKR